MPSEKELPSKFCVIKGKKMSYVELGSGDPIVFLHGNPTSSYLWRNIMPHLSHQGRCLAPDLIGMGNSDKLDHSGPSSYTFAQHREFLDALFSKLEITKNVTLVLHDWGSALGFDWAFRHPEAIKGISYMEAIVDTYSWEDWPEQSRRIFQGLRSDAGEDMILNKNVFIEKVLPGSILRKLTENEMAIYRRPFHEPGESRRPTLTWPRQIPIDGHPEDVTKIVKNYSQWMETTNFPKLFINANPGAILTGRHRKYCKTWPNQKEVTISGVHFVQEDSPDEIGQAIAQWLTRLT